MRMSYGIAAVCSSDLGGTSDATHPGLRLHLPDGPEGQFTAVVQMRSRLDPSLVIDAADLWDAPEPVLARLGDQVDAELLLALRRGSRAWPPLGRLRSEEHTSALQSLMRISYAVFCLK